MISPLSFLLPWRRRPWFAPLLLALAPLVAPVAAQPAGGPGAAAEGVRAIGPFHAVVARGSLQVVLKPGTTERVILTGDPRQVAQVETQVTEGVLQIGQRRGFTWTSRDTPTAIVEYVNLRSVTSHGAADIEVESIRGEVFDLTLNGSGDARIGASQLGVLAVLIRGSGNLSATGVALRQGFVILGSGDVDTAELAGRDVAVKIRGSGNAHVAAEQVLDVDVAGSGDVLYRGRPRVSRRIAGTGNVRAEE